MKSKESLTRKWKYESTRHILSEKVAVDVCDNNEERIRILYDPSVTPGGYLYTIPLSMEEAGTLVKYLLRVIEL
jgi:hypothetical protein